MIHPLLRLAVTEPHLLGDHVSAYASLVGEEAAKASTAWITRIGLYVAAVAMVVLGVVLVGIALLLAAALPSGDYPAAWAMFVVPATPFVVAAVCVLVARSKPIATAFGRVKAQLDADMAMLREVSAS